MHEVFVDLVDARWDEHSGVLISRGSFATVEAALPSFRAQGITTLYLMGALERDNGTAPVFERPDESPFSVVNRAHPNEMLGGTKGFAALTDAASALGMRVIIDSMCQVSGSRVHKKYRGILCDMIDKRGRKVNHYGTDGKEVQWVDTLVLNARKKQCWEQLVDDISSMARKFKVGGVRLDNAMAWPLILPVDLDEMLRTDEEGAQYTPQEIVDGEVVKPSKFEEAVYWRTAAAASYPNPMLVKLTREIWREHPHFLFLGESAFGRERALLRSGVIPYASDPVAALHSVFGKAVHRDGTISERPRTDCTPLYEWYEREFTRMPRGAVLVKGSCSHDLPYPARLYQRGAWAAIDLLYFGPEVPITYMGEQEGLAFAIDVSKIRSAKPTNASAADLKHQRSFNREVEYQNQVNVIGFDLAKIGAHYKHRSLIRHQYPALQYGEIIPLFARSRNDGRMDEWMSRVLSFARYHQPEAGQPGRAQLMVVAINFSENSSTFYVDFARLAHKLEDDGEAMIYQLIDVINTSVPPRFVGRHELLHSQSLTTLHPYSSSCWEIVPQRMSAEIEREMFRSSMSQLTELMDKGQPIVNNFMYQKIVRSLNSEDEFFAMCHSLVTKSSWQASAPVLRRTLYEASRVDEPTERRVSALVQVAAVEATDPDVRLLGMSVLEANRVGAVVFIAPELGKWSKVGGLGVMVDELTLMLADLGVEVHVITPYYEHSQNRKFERGYLQKDGFTFKQLLRVTLGPLGGSHELGLHEGMHGRVHMHFVHNATFFDEPYQDGTVEFRLRPIAVLAKASLEVCCQLHLRPSVIVTNDWATGLVPAYAKEGSFGAFFEATTFFHLVHNLNENYEGRIYHNNPESLSAIHGLPAHYLVDPFWRARCLNPSRCALLCSTAWGTVSQSYREEILRDSPLNALLKRFDNPFAFSNGVPVAVREAVLYSEVAPDHISAKAKLQHTFFATELRDDIPVFCFVGRITEQKGVHLIVNTVEELLHRFEHKLQIIVGGMVNWKEPYSAQCGHKMNELRAKYPQNFWAGPNEFFTQGSLTNLGADFALMPSLFEPGGVVQHEFFVGGTPVLCFKTGGLKDSVHEFNPYTKQGSGFTFETHNEGDYM
jgi:glycogen synthase